MTITAKVVLDSISEEGVRLTTMELTYPRFIHAEFMTHRMFSRNASSSRAIPVERMLEQIERNPVTPSYWGQNRPGMQAHDELPWDAQVQANKAWTMARMDAIRHARRLHDLGAHKQIVNRILEPFAHITVLVTATEWENFYKLRRHRDAQPEIHALADAMYEAQMNSVPRKLMHGEWHLPYVTDDDLDDIIKLALHQAQDTTFGQAELEDVERATTRIACRVSTARCARVSYLTHDGQKPDIAKDDQLFHRLMIAQPMHASPAEHQATPDRTVRYGTVSAIGWENPQFHGNFVGWQQHRKFFLGENTPSNQLTKHGVLTADTVSKVTSLHSVKPVDTPVNLG
jgi:thymidylate synthase ThyX